MGDTFPLWRLTGQLTIQADLVRPSKQVLDSVRKLEYLEKTQPCTRRICKDSAEKQVESFFLIALVTTAKLCCPSMQIGFMLSLTKICFKLVKS